MREAGSQEAPLVWFGFAMKIDWPSESSAQVSRAGPALGEVGDMYVEERRAWIDPPLEGVMGSRGLCEGARG